MKQDSKLIKYNDPHNLKELSKLKYREIAVVIVFCTGCNKHNKTLKHDEDKYKSLAEEMKNHLSQEFSFLKIYLKPIDDVFDFKKIGSFEIYFKSYNMESPVIISSKLQTLKWPNKNITSNNIRNYLIPINIEVKLEIENIEMLNINENNDILAGIDVKLITYNNGNNKNLKEINFKNEKNKIKENEEGKNLLRPKSSISRKTERIFSATVEKKVESKYLDGSKLYSMINNFGNQFNSISNENGVIEFLDIQPGKYILIVKKSEYFKATSKKIEIKNSFKENTKQSFNIKLEAEELSSVKFEIIEEDDQQILSVNLIPENNNDFDMINDELENEPDKYVDNQLVKTFKGNFLVGNYNLKIEFDNGNIINKELKLYSGENNYFISNIEDDLNRETNLNNNLNQNEIINEEEENNTEDENNENKLPENNNTISENYNKTISENKKNNSDINSKDENQNQNHKKNRVLSGKVRPGERNHSAKSQKNHQVIEKNIDINNSQKDLNNENPIIENQYQEIIKNQNLINIIFDSNDNFSLIVLTPKDPIMLGQNNEFGKIETKNDFTMVELNNEALKKENYFRLILNIYNTDIKKNINFVIIYNDYKYEIPIGNILKNLKDIENVNMFDLGIISKNCKSLFSPFMYHTNESIELTTGLIEIKKLVNYIRNSKFKVTKFFGFEGKENEENKDFILKKKVCQDILKSYEMNHNTFILNCVLVNNDEISCRKVEEKYLIWEELFDKLDLNELESFDFEDEDDVSDDNFEY